MKTFKMFCEVIALDDPNKKLKHYNIINIKTGTSVGTAKTRKGAYRSIDKRDNEYGAYVHHAEPVYEETIDESSFEHRYASYHKQWAQHHLENSGDKHNKAANAHLDAASAFRTNKSNAYHLSNVARQASINAGEDPKSLSSRLQEEIIIEAITEHANAEHHHTLMVAGWRAVEHTNFKHGPKATVYRHYKYPSHSILSIDSGKWTHMHDLPDKVKTSSYGTNTESLRKHLNDFHSSAGK